VIAGMNHFTVIAGDPAKTRAYYCELLGFVEGHRPDIGFPGAWLYAPDDPTRPILHIYFDRPVPSNPAGAIDHMAFSARGLAAVKARFDAAGVRYDLRQQKGSGIWQLFSHDPAGAKVELDFDPSETLVD
jgi:catechol 2,3-dioxygenase-like lactoylglutathione lyase family enzyme